MILEYCPRIGDLARTDVPRVVALFAALSKSDWLMYLPILILSTGVDDHDGPLKTHR